MSDWADQRLYVRVTRVEALTSESYSDAWIEAQDIDGTLIRWKTNSAKAEEYRVGKVLDIDVRIRR